MELRDHFESGLRAGGFGGTKDSRGNYENDEFGSYTLAAYNDVDRCIVVHHSGGAGSHHHMAEGTASMYDEVCTRI